MSEKLTTKQKMVLEALSYFIKENGYSPTYQELADMLKSDKTSVFQKILILEAKGYVKQVSGTQRTLRVIKNDEC